MEANAGSAEDRGEEAGEECSGVRRGQVHGKAGGAVGGGGWTVSFTACDSLLNITYTY